MGIFRALLLSFSFALAVKLGLGLWNCGTQGPEARWENLAGRHQFVAGYIHMFSVSTCEVRSLIITATVGNLLEPIIGLKMMKV